MRDYIIEFAHWILNDADVKDAEIAALREEAAALREEAADLRAELMGSRFDTDDHPGRPKILFIGEPSSTHTASWIRMLDGSALNVRLFSPYRFDPGPHESLRVRCYLAADHYVAGPLRRRISISPNTETEPALRRGLARVVHDWRPDIVHSMGFFDSGRFFAEARREHGLQRAVKWVLQTRGGSDVELTRFVPEKADKLRAAVLDADQIISDNSHNFECFTAWGVRPEQLSRVGPVPGAGGLDFCTASDGGMPSAQRRLILWPKAYNTAYAQALPVLEGIRLAWERIKPCRIVMLWTVQPEIREWIAALPPEIRDCCDVHGQVPHDEVKRLMGEARIMLAPSLVDGTPNSMFEAMAAGALPIVSPLPTLRDVVQNEQNVLFARNLYPEEIAAALVRGMTDNSLLDRIVAANHVRVRQIADRSVVRERITRLYEELAAEHRASCPTEPE